MNFSEVHQSSQALVEAAYPVAAWVALAVAVLGIAFLAAVVSAARRAAALLADFLQLAAAMTSVMLTMALGVVVVITLLVHR